MRSYAGENLDSHNHAYALAGFALVLSIAILVSMSSATNKMDITISEEASQTQSESEPPCLSKRDISNALRKLASGKSPGIDIARAVLLDKAKSSPSCRLEVIAALMKSMDKPNLDFHHDTHSYYLWLCGGALLGELRAGEAIDLLISHLNLTTGFFNSSMNHQPALKGLIKMGPIAIPKLAEVLQHNPDRKMRYSAVYCIATIGGDSAVISLREALRSESDDCIRQAIRASLETLENQGHIKNRMVWFSGFVTCK